MASKSTNKRRLSVDAECAVTKIKKQKLCGDSYDINIDPSPPSRAQLHEQVQKTYKCIVKSRENLNLDDMNDKRLARRQVLKN